MLWRLGTGGWAGVILSQLHIGATHVDKPTKSPRTAIEVVSLPRLIGILVRHVPVVTTPPDFAATMMTLEISVKLGPQYHNSKSRGGQCLPP